MATRKVVIFLNIHCSQSGAVISAKKYNPVSPFPEFYDTWGLISQDETKIGWICGACIREPWKDLWVPYRLEGMLELWRLDKQIGLDICGFSSAGKETIQSHLWIWISLWLDYSLSSLLGSRWSWERDVITSRLQMGERDETQRGRMSWVILLTVRAKIWTQASWLQVCGPSTALQLFPEPLSWVIQVKQPASCYLRGKSV